MDTPARRDALTAAVVDPPPADAAAAPAVRALLARAEETGQPSPWPL